MIGFDRTYCDRFQSSLAFKFIDTIWKQFRQAGNSLEGKVGRGNFKKIINRAMTGRQHNQYFLDKLFDRFRLDRSNISGVSNVASTINTPSQPMTSNLTNPNILSTNIGNSSNTTNSITTNNNNFNNTNNNLINMNMMAQRQEIDLQDLVIGLAVMMRINFDNKVRYLFYWTDLDQDGCLSLDEIQSMIGRIQKIFCKENSAAQVDSHTLLFQNAQRKSRRHYQQILSLLQRKNHTLTDDQSCLITLEQFMQALKLSRDLYLEQKFVPLNLALWDIIGNTVSQPIIRIHQENKQQFCQFRKEICNILHNKKDNGGLGSNGHGREGPLRYPGRVQIIKTQIDSQTGQEILPNIERNPQKKNQRLPIATKNKTTNGVSITINNHTSNNITNGNGISNSNGYPNNSMNNPPNSTAHSTNYYHNRQTGDRLKVKKMIETKMDPRLNAKLFRKP